MSCDGLGSPFASSNLFYVEYSHDEAIHRPSTLIAQFEYLNRLY